MAEAQDTSQAAEPSMEEILASIRKIISDDAPPEATASEDVIELTQAVEEDGSVTPVEPEPAPVAAAAPSKPAPPVSPTENLISKNAASAASSALSSLANTVEIERLAATPVTATYMGNGARTLEDMVIELMRPLLKQWLDENLPATVDRLVQKEIERISRRS